MRIEIDDVSRPAGDRAARRAPEQHVRADAARGTCSRSTRAGSGLQASRSGRRGEDETLLGCAAVKELSPTQGEVKSMRTPANLRGRGAGRALLEHILHVCRERGYQELFLETGLSASLRARADAVSQCGLQRVRALRLLQRKWNQRLHVAAAVECSLGWPPNLGCSQPAACDARHGADAVRSVQSCTRPN